MNDRFSNPILHYGFLAAIYGVGLGTLFFHTIGHALSQKPPTPANCTITGVVRQVSVNAGGIDPVKLEGHFCDQVTFTNYDSKPHLLALGVHERHDDYPGFIEKTIAPKQSLSITLGAVGTYPLHDHLHANLHGEIIITK